VASTKLVETDLSAVEKALKAKIAHTEQLKVGFSMPAETATCRLTLPPSPSPQNTLHSVLVDTVNEIELCIQLKASLVGRLQAIEKKAELNDSRLQVRTGHSILSCILVFIITC
jgi:hypothetical protein